MAKFIVNAVVAIMLAGGAGFAGLAKAGEPVPPPKPPCQQQQQCPKPQPKPEPPQKPWQK